MDFKVERLAVVDPEESALTGIASGTAIGEIDIIDLHERYQRLVIQASVLLGPCNETEQPVADVQPHRPDLDKIEDDIIVLSSAIISVAVQRERLARGMASDQA